MLLYLFIWEHFISRIIEYSFHKVTHQTAIVMVVLLVIMLAIGVSISVAVGLSSALAMLCMLDANISFATSAQRLFAGANSFSLIAIPFFILAGNIMNNGGIAERIVNVAKVVAGRMPGALAQSNVVANMLFGAISGSGAAAAAAMGGTIGPMEKKEGYDPVYSAGVNIASAPTGMLIPPSNLMIVYSTIAGSVSVAALFMGGYVPGILWGLLVMFLAGVKAKKCGYVAERRIPAKMTGIITFMIGLSSIMSWVMAFTGAKVGNVKIEQVFKELLPYFGVILIVLLLTTCIPAISMTLPTAAGLIQ